MENPLFQYFQITWAVSLHNKLTSKFWLVSLAAREKFRKHKDDNNQISDTHFHVNSSKSNVVDDGYEINRMYSQTAISQTGIASLLTFSVISYCRHKCLLTKCTQNHVIGSNWFTFKLSSHRWDQGNDAFISVPFHGNSAVPLLYTAHYNHFLFR